MKKLFALILVLTLAVSLCACGDKEKTPPAGDQDGTEQSQPTQPSQPQQSEKPKTKTTVSIDPAVRPQWEEFAVYITGPNGIGNGDYPGDVLTEADKNDDGYFVYELPAELQGKNTLKVTVSNNATAENGRTEEKIEASTLTMNATEQMMLCPGADFAWEPYTYFSDGTAEIYINPDVRPQWEEYAIYIYGDDGSNNGSWPGALMDESYMDEYGFYVYTLPEELQGKDNLHVIFNNNPTAENGRTEEKIEDGTLVMNNGQKMLIHAAGGWSWVRYSPTGEGVTTILIDPEIRPDWEEFAVYLWGNDGSSNGGWPGTVLTDEDKNEDGIYVYKLPLELQDKESMHVILNNNPTAENGREEEKIEDGVLVIKMGQKMIFTPVFSYSGWSWEEYTK